MLRLLRGHVLDRLGELRESVHCVVTSPPYYGLRSYGTEPQIWGGDPLCQHVWGEQQFKYGGGGQPGAKVRWQHTGEGVKGHAPADAGKFCQICGAWIGHLGLENTLDLYLDHMVEICREIRRVLRKDGTFWMNIGDSYAAQGGPGAGGNAARMGRANQQRNERHNPGKADGFKPKDLMLIPSRLAIRLCDDGWWVRSDIAWCKRAPMPESCTDRPTTAWEHVFLLTKSGSPQYWTHRDHAGSRTKPAPDYRWVDHDNDDAETDVEPPNWRTETYLDDKGKPQKRWSRINLWQAHDYFYDQEAVKEDAEYGRRDWNGEDHFKSGDITRGHKGTTTGGETGGKRNLRNVWKLGPEPFPEAHFATFPSEIPRICIKAGTSEKGVCPKCGAPWERVVKKTFRATRTGVKSGAGNALDPSSGWDQEPSGVNNVETIGWQPTCSCDAGEPIPATVLDPFLGSGTTALVADQLQRDCIGIELSPEYATMADRRVREDAGMFAALAAE